jgi:hypothetical protein
LRRLAQYLLSAAKQLQDRTIGENAYGLLKEWHKAAEPLRQYVGEFPGSCADTATKRAMGMLVAPQLAKDAAAMECESLLSKDEEIKNKLADACWIEAADGITSDVIRAYHVALEKGQS